MTEQEQQRAAAFIPYAEEGFLLTLTNRGIYNRSRKDYESLGDGAAISFDGENQAVDLGEARVVLKEPVKDSVCSCPSQGICKHILMSLFAIKDALHAENDPEPGAAVVADNTVEKFSCLLRADLAALKKEAGKKLFTEALEETEDGNGAVFPSPEADPLPETEAPEDTAAREGERALLENARAVYRSVPWGNFTGLGAWPWLTRSGFAGVSCLIFHRERNTLLFYTTALPDWKAAFHTPLLAAAKCNIFIIPHPVLYRFIHNLYGFIQKKFVDSAPGRVYTNQNGGMRMKPYEIYASEKRTFQDRMSGVTVWQLTGYRGHSEHPYFTDDGWYDGDRRMLFVSDRANARNLFSIEIESGEMSRLTDMPAGGPELRCPMQVNRALNETYYHYRGCVYGINLSTLETRPLYIIPHGFNFGGARPTGDGKYIVAGLTEDLSATIKSNLAASYIGFEEIFAAKPECRIVRVCLADNTVEEVWREKCWVGHVNPSPVRGNLLTFCHEGPWQMVDHRIWMLDLDTGKAVKFRPRRESGEMIGHEYWFFDGEHVGYQVHQGAEGEQHSLFGFARYDGSGEVEAPAVRVPGPDHIHSAGFDFVVSDTGKSIKGYKYNGKSFDGPRIITMHDGSFDWGAHHPHPAVTRDGKFVVYNSTAAGYCNIYMTAIPEDFYALPPLEVKG